MIPEILSAKQQQQQLNVPPADANSRQVLQEQLAREHATLAKDRQKAEKQQKSDEVCFDTHQMHING